MSFEFYQHFKNVMQILSQKIPSPHVLLSGPIYPIVQSSHSTYFSSGDFISGVKAGL